MYLITFGILCMGLNFKNHFNCCDDLLMMIPDIILQLSLLRVMIIAVLYDVSRSDATHLLENSKLDNHGFI